MAVLKMEVAPYFRLCSIFFFFFFCFDLHIKQLYDTISLLCIIFSFFRLKNLKLLYNPSLNTQSCIKGLMVVGDFCFWATDYETSLKCVSRFFLLFALYIIKVRLNTLDITHSLTRSLPLFCQQVAFILRK